MLLVSDFVYSSLLNIKMSTQCRVLALALVLDDCFKYSKNLLVKKNTLKKMPSQVVFTTERLWDNLDTIKIYKI